MNTNTIARLPADRAPRMIDLTRSLPDLRASLSPGLPPLPSASRQDGDDFAAGATRIFLLFLAFFAGCIGCYLMSQ